MYAITAQYIFNGDDLLEQHAVLIDADKIIDVVKTNAIPNHSEKLDFPNQLIAPGFIDIQVNGGGGKLFNETPTLETLRTIANTHRRFGTTGFFPTLISTDDTHMRAASQAVKQALAENMPGVLGLHFEGPWLNMVKKGIHPAIHVRHPEDDIAQLLKEVAVPNTLLTIAPELFDSQTIQQLVAQNINIAAGHSHATYTELEAAVDAGITCITHLFNTCTQLTSREPGVVGAALLDQRLWSSIIVDGHHVSYATLRIALNAKDYKKFILISDAMTAVGTDITEFKLADEVIYVRDGKYTNDVGTLAGSALDMATALRNTVQYLHVPLAEALRMTSTNAAEMLGFDKTIGRLASGMQADLVILNKNLNVQQVIQRGKIIF